MQPRWPPKAIKAHSICSSLMKSVAKYRFSHMISPTKYRVTQKKTEKWYLKCLYVPIFLNFIHIVLGIFIMDVLLRDNALKTATLPAVTMKYYGHLFYFQYWMSSVKTWRYLILMYVTESLIIYKSYQLQIWAKKICILIGFDAGVS